MAKALNRIRSVFAVALIAGAFQIGPLAAESIVSPESLLGRWYTELSETTEPDADGDVAVIKICMYAERFANKMENFQGEAQYSFRSKGESVVRLDTSFDLRGALEWSLSGDTLISKITAIRLRANDVIWYVDNKKIDETSLTEDMKKQTEIFKTEFHSMMSHMLYEGQTSQDTIIKIDANSIYTKTINDDGKTSMSEQIRVVRLGDKCK